MLELEEPCDGVLRKSSENLVRSISKEEIKLLEGENQRRSSFGVMFTIIVIILLFNVAMFMSEPLLQVIRAHRSFFLRGSVHVYDGERTTGIGLPGNEISKILLPQLQTDGENEFLLTGFMDIISAKSSPEITDNSVDVVDRDDNVNIAMKSSSDEVFSQKRSEIVGKVEVF